MNQIEQADQSERGIGRAFHDWFYSGEFVWPCSAFLANLCALAASPIGGATSNPPQPISIRLLAVAIVMAAFGITFLASRSCKLATTRLLLAIQLPLPLLAVSLPLLGYYQEWNQMPWEVILPLAAVLLMGARWGRMGWFAICLVVFVALFAVGDRVMRI